ncbi:MAG: FCD domain-containing protein [Protaetiibacter sp.]
MESDAEGRRLTVARLAGILERDLADRPAGFRLPSERRLSEEHGVSRPVVREALRALEERGQISTQVGRGSFVRAPSERDLELPLARLALRVGATPRDVVRARTVLECIAVEDAALAANEEQLAALRRSWEQHDRARSLSDRVETDFAFHAAIVRIAGNPVIEIMFGSIRTLVLGLMIRSHSDPGVRAIGDPMHVRILECMAARDAAGAREAMREHLTLALELYGDDLDRDLREVLDGRITPR